MIYRFLRGGAGLRRVPRGGDEVRKFSPSNRVGRRWGKTKPYRAETKTLSFGPILLRCHP